MTAICGGALSAAPKRTRCRSPKISCIEADAVMAALGRLQVGDEVELLVPISRSFPKTLHISEIRPNRDIVLTSPDLVAMTIIIEAAYIAERVRFVGRS